ncbi:MAG: hypothetical protein QXT68_02770 [Halobacteria archaeon]
MRIRVQVSDERGSEALQEFTFPEEDPSKFQATLAEAIEFLKRKASQMARKVDAALTGPTPIPDPGRGPRLPGLTTMETLQGFLETDFPEGWFTSLDVQRSFREVHGAVSLSTVSTYLSRLHRSGLLERGGNRRRWAYRLAAGRPAGGAREITLP